MDDPVNIDMDFEDALKTILDVDEDADDETDDG